MTLWTIVKQKSSHLRSFNTLSYISEKLNANTQSMERRERWLNTSLWQMRICSCWFIQIITMINRKRKSFRTLQDNSNTLKVMIMNTTTPKTFLKESMMFVNLNISRYAMRVSTSSTVTTRWARWNTFRKYFTLKTLLSMIELFLLLTKNKVVYSFITTRSQTASKK